VPEDLILDRLAVGNGGDGFIDQSVEVGLDVRITHQMRVAAQHRRFSLSSEALTKMATRRRAGGKRHGGGRR